MNTKTSESSAAAAPLNVGIVGLGRSGWNIHAKSLAQMPDRYRIASVCDPEPARRDEARQVHGCETFETFEQLIEAGGLDLVVVASPNHLHTDHSITALAAGCHVVCEKPFALDLADADRAIAAAERYGRVLSPFQHRRYESHFLKIKELIASGVLGEIVHARLAWHQFTRRWDWQTLNRFGGGLLNNNGSHLLDHALQLLPDDAEPEVFADLQRVLSLGDTEDHVKIVMRTPGQPTIEIELSNACAYPQDRWLIMGSRGGLRGTDTDLQWRTVDFADLPERRLETAAATGRQYSTDQITWQEHSWSPAADDPGAYWRYYDDLYRTIVDGAPLVIDGPSVRRLISTLLKAKASSPLQLDGAQDPSASATARGPAAVAASNGTASSATNRSGTATASSAAPGGTGP